jgi:hypothetical protein
MCRLVGPASPVFMRFLSAKQSNFGSLTLGAFPMRLLSPFFSVVGSASEIYYFSMRKRPHRDAIQVTYRNYADRKKKKLRIAEHKKRPYNIPLDLNLLRYDSHAPWL